MPVLHDPILLLLLLATNSSVLQIIGTSSLHLSLSRVSFNLGFEQVLKRKEKNTSRQPKVKIHEQVLTWDLGGAAEKRPSYAVSRITRATLL